MTDPTSPFTHDLPGTPACGSGLRAAGGIPPSLHFLSFPA